MKIYFLCHLQYFVNIRILYLMNLQILKKNTNLTHLNNNSEVMYLVANNDWFLNFYQYN